jgi:hypothetical protein
MNSTRWAIVAGAIAVGCALGALLIGMATTLEVLEEGKLLPYSEGHIYRLRFFGFLELYAEPSRRPKIPDVVNTFILLSLSGVMLASGLAMRSAGERGRRAARFFLLVWLGTAFLGADELLGVHESVGHNLPFLLSIPGIQRPDDFLLLLYGAVGLGAVIVFRDVVLFSRRARPVFAVAIAAALFVAVLDVLGSPWEEAMELVASTGMLGGFILLAVDYLTLVLPGAATGYARARVRSPQAV